jgi:hypothetical protein
MNSMKYRPMEQVEIDRLLCGDEDTAELVRILKDVNKNEGVVIGPFETHNRAKNVRMKLGAAVKQLGWNNPKWDEEKRKPAYKTDVITGVDGQSYIRVVRTI